MLGFEASECGLLRRLACISRPKDFISDLLANVVPPWSRYVNPISN
jgi:hypothetical protein